MNIVITGASSGIGKALAQAYARGATQEQAVNLGLISRSQTALETLKAQLTTQYQVQASIYVVDVRDSDGMMQAAKAFMHQYGAPNIVIANAGVSSGTLTEQMEDAAVFKAVMDINVLGLVHTFQPFIVKMQQIASVGESAQLVGIASVAGIRGLPGAGAYSASKAAAITYLESLRIEMAKYQIAVTTIAPGYIRTPMTEINDYSMPFLMDADEAAIKFVTAIDKKIRYCVIPWQMGIVAKLMRCIPTFIWDKLMCNAPHKRRIEVD
jgi:short-subunit dehydrogenase